MMALKVNAYGIAANAFHDYYQMGESMARKCCKCFNEAISTCKKLTNVFLCKMTKNDAKRIVELHKQKHGVAGLLGSLDCMHVICKNCPIALQGAFMGKEGCPTIVLEAMADFNLWIWHAAFGFSGSLNDLNIWENSLLPDDMVSGAFSMINFTFEVGGRIFDKLFFLVDGIYMEILHFARSISVPTGRDEKYYSSWQEAVRKDIEHAFGVLQCKFQIIAHPIKKWDELRIKQMVCACILLHNMMVPEHINNGNDEDAEDFHGMYDPVEDNNVTNEEGDSNTETDNEGEDDVEEGDNFFNDTANNENANNEESNSAIVAINDAAAQHVQQVEAEVVH